MGDASAAGVHRKVGDHRTWPTSRMMGLAQHKRRCTAHRDKAVRHAVPLPDPWPASSLVTLGPPGISTP